jgi:hypothetical protein
MAVFVYSIHPNFPYPPKQEAVSWTWPALANSLKSEFFHAFEERVGGGGGPKFDGNFLK